MAIRVANATGTTSTSTTGWDTATNTPTIHASTNISVTSTGILSATFTAPNTANKSTGVLVHLVAVPSQNWTATLQESGVNTTATATITTANFPALPSGVNPASLWVYFRWGTPYQFTTTTAGAYRIQLKTASSTSGTVAADSGAANFAYIATDDRTGALGSTDDIWVAAHNASTAIAVTMTGTSNTIGSGADTTGGTNNVNPRSIGNAINIYGGSTAQTAQLIWDTSASASATVKGSITVWPGGELQMGTVASPYPSAFAATLTFNENGTTGNYGLSVSTGGKLTLQGAAKPDTSLWKTKYSSGSGTIASPLITADNTNWSVGDELAICATGNDAANYSENEDLTITTVNAANSYVLSAPLAFTHTTDAWIINLTRNVVIQTTSTAQAWYGTCSSSTVGDIAIKWVRFTTIGANSGTFYKQAFYPVALISAAVANMDYTVAYGAQEGAFGFNVSTTAGSYTGLVGAFTNTSTSRGTFYCSSGNNRTFNTCFAVGNNRSAVEVNGAPAYTFNNCYFIGNNSANQVAGAVALINTGLVTFNSCEFHCNRSNAVYFNGASNCAFNNCLFGTKGNNTVDMSAVANTSNVNNLFSTCTLSSPTLLSNYTTAGTSDWEFQNLGGVTNQHYWYTNYGIGQSTGAGLTDTNTRTSGELSVRLSPQTTNTTGQWVQWNIVASANSTVFVQGYIQQNAAFTGDASATCRVDLWLPGLVPGTDTASYTYTMPKTDNTFDPFVVYAAYSGSVPLLATVRVTAVSNTTGAYVYVADLYNGGSSLSNMSTWYNGRPAPLIVQTAGDAATIWSYPTANLTTSGTTGNQLAAKVLTTGKFIGLK